MHRPRALRERLDETLFLGAPPAEAGGARGERIAIAACLLALAVVLQLLRLGWTASLDSLWAEDGAIFLQGALTQGFDQVVFSPYSNYLVLVPRLIGEIAALVPLRDAPAAVSIASAALVALSGLVVWHAAAGHIRSPYLRGALTAATVLAPVAGLESIDSASYVSWYMLFATFWVLLWRPRTAWGAGLASLFVLATALSNPGVWFFIPLAALRAIAIRDGRDLAIVASFAIGAASQIPVLAFSQGDAVEPLWTSQIWTVYLQRVVDGAALGLRLGGFAWEALGWPLLIGLTLCGVAGLAVGARRAAPAARYIAAIAIPTSLAMFVASLYQRAVATQMVWPAGDHNGSGGRYAIVPALLLVSVALVLLDGSSWGRGRGNRPSRAIVVTAAVLLVAVATSFYARNVEVRGTPRWDAALESAAAICAAQGVPSAAIPISPPGFGMQLPCDQILTAHPSARPASAVPSTDPPPGAGGGARGSAREASAGR
jgi:hypothetical protein